MVVGMPLWGCRYAQPLGVSRSAAGLAWGADGIVCGGMTGPTGAAGRLGRGERTVRTFVALELPDTMRAEIVDLARCLAGRVTGRFVPGENYHLTLAFLGEIGEAESRDAIAAMDEVAAGRGPVRLRPTGLGTFGKPSDCTLWLGIEAASELVALAEELRAALAARGIAFDGKPLRPHITLARRVRLPKGELAPLVFPEPAYAAHMTLFKSTLTPEGAIYKPLYRAELKFVPTTLA